MQEGFDLPAEEMSRVKAGTTYSWPKCYFDARQKKLVLAPEYGGDGGKKYGVCAGFDRPIAAFPAHWAPNDMKIYKGIGISAEVPRRRVHCLSRFVEHLGTARRLQCRLSDPCESARLPERTRYSRTALPGDRERAASCEALSHRAGCGSVCSALYSIQGGAFGV